jgi:excisionase family DNA binding protein
VVHVNDNNELLTPAQAAHMLGVTTTTLTRWVHAGQIPAVTIPSGVHRYRRTDIERLTEPEFVDDGEAWSKHFAGETPAPDLQRSAESNENHKTDTDSD